VDKTDFMQININAFGNAEKMKVDEEPAEEYNSESDKIEDNET